MRIIPGNTKVKIEIFKGFDLWDILASAIAAIMLACIVVSTIPFKAVFAAIHIIISVVLIARLDKEANYVYLLHIIRHFGIGRNYDRKDTDKILQDYFKRGDDAVAFDEIFSEEKTEEAPAEEEHIETKQERKERLKAQKKEYKEDTKLLKSKTLTKEEEDAIWLKRAQQAADDKKAKQAAKIASGKKKAKWEDMENINAFSGISDEYIEYDNGHYFGAVLEVPCVEFKFFSEFRRNNSIENALGAVIRSIRSDYSVNIVKIERPVSYDRYRRGETEKLEELRASYEQGFMSEDELKARVAIVYDRIYALDALKEDKRVIIPFYYLVLFESDKKQLENMVRNCIDTLKIGEMYATRVTGAKQLAIFLKYQNALDFEESEIESIRPEDYVKWAMPEKVQFTPRTTVVNGIATHNFRVVSYPTAVYDAWLASLMTYPSTKVVVKLKPMDSGKAINSIDRSLSELRGKVNSARTDSEAMEAQEHLETLQYLLSQLQSENEQLLNVNIYVTGYDVVATEENPKLDPLETPSFRYRVNNMKKIIRRVWKEAGFGLNNNEFNQAIAFIGSQVSGYDAFEKEGRGIPSNSVAACFPWVFPHIMDENGVQLGTSDGVPIFIDFFKRDSERVNSNMVIVGKSGSGKSFATKSLLSHLAADDAKIFILDPEDEYRTLAKNLNGKFINVANAKYGRLNPFHIFTTLDDEDNEGGLDSATGSYATHLQFLEEFFKQILPDCDKDSLEYLNSLVDRVYANKGITPHTDLSKLQPSDYPVFDDLYDEILREFQRTDNEYIKTMLRSLMNYVSKFSEGGRNSIIWNGPSTITTDENFTVFNFQSLLANRNSTIANAQMLLVLKYIDNEIIKNREYNERYDLHRKIVVVIDEAHVFIDTKYPVALDFMFQLAKRIRKYNGMQIVITQNIKDFVGSEEIARKSTAIINACQYSFIFSLAPNDMDDLCKLYEKAGGINESEQEQIVQAQRGHAFTVLGPSSRTSFKITVPGNVRTLFSKSSYENPYFTGIGGDENWADFIKDSTDKRWINLEARGIDAAEYDKPKNYDFDDSAVSFDEISEEALDLTPIEAPLEIEEISEAAAPIDIQLDFREEDLAGDAAQLEELKKELAPQTMLAGQGISTITETASKTQEILAGLVDKLTIENLRNEIEKAVRDEIAKTAVPAAAPVAPVTPMDSIVSTMLSDDEVEEDEEEETEVATIGASSIFDFGSFDEDEEEEESSSDSEEGGVALGSIFDFADMADIDDYQDELTDTNEEVDEDDDEDEGDHFDIMAFLSQQADEAEAEEEVSKIDDFESSGETTLEITLEQLIAYTRKKK